MNTGNHQCSICCKSFRSVAFLNRHKMKHMAISVGYNGVKCNHLVSEYHVCTYDSDRCTNTFSSMILLKKHKKIHLLTEASVLIAHEIHDHNIEVQLMNLKFA